MDLDSLPVKLSITFNCISKCKFLCIINACEFNMLKIKIICLYNTNFCIYLDRTNILKS